LNILIAIGVMRRKEAGAAGVVFNHGAELQKLGHQVETWFFDDILPSPRWPVRFQDVEFAFLVSRRIRQNPEKYDVVNLHAPWGCVYGLSRKIFSSNPLPPYVFTMQGSEERYALAMRLEHKRGRATNFALHNRLWHRLYHQTLYDFSISTADFGVVANREGWILSELKYGHPPGRVWYVPNGVDPRFILPRTFAESPANRLLYVGTWLDRKGIFYLVDSLSTLVQRLPEITLTVAGCLCSEDRVKTYFPSELRSRVTVIPLLDRDAMPDLYASHDVFVFPSLVEGMPLTVLEAMASAMPVVTTNTCGMSDLIEDGVNGLLVPAADSIQFAHATLSVCTSIQWRKILGSAAQETVRRFTWPSVARDLERVLRSAVLAKNPAAPP
jgi:glycosyltransferase involved in cell wall biosynthesis